MADGVAITAGSGTTIATDDLGAGGHYQRVKACWGVDGVANDTSATNPLPTQEIPSTSNGLTVYYLTSAASTNGNNIKASAAKVYSITATNTSASVRYLRLYNASGAPTVGTTATFAGFAIPGSTTGGGLHLTFPAGLTLGTGLGLSLTTGAADTDTGGVAANEIKVVIGYV